MNFIGHESKGHDFISDSSLNPLKKDGLYVRNIGKPQVSFLFAVCYLQVI